MEPPPKAAGITQGPDRSLIRPYFMPLPTKCVEDRYEPRVARNSTI